MVIEIPRDKDPEIDELLKTPIITPGSNKQVLTDTDFYKKRIFPEKLIRAAENVSYHTLEELDGIATGDDVLIPDNSVPSNKKINNIIRGVRGYKKIK